MDQDEESRSHTQCDSDTVDILGIGADKIEFTKDSCCYSSSGLHGDICEEYERQICKSENFVRSLVFIGFQMGNTEPLQSLKYISEREVEMYGKGKRELLTWFGKPRRTLSLNETNLFAVFCDILRRG
jgi:hypothetical protein